MATPLACPRCDKLLDIEANDAARCDACQVSFPTLNNVSFLYADPDASLADWRNRWNFALAELDSDYAAVRGAAPGAKGTRQRLADYAVGLERYRNELTALLAPLDVGEALAKETHLALRTRLPRHHHVLSYMPNIYRDWCWGQEENALALQTVLGSLESADVMSAQRILVLGSGAGRLAYDLHRHFQAQTTVALDSNPLLCMIAAAVTGGNELTLTELPLAPIGVEHVAVARKLSAPAAVADMHFVCADALRSPFAPQSFDLVVTPWLIDVIDATPQELMAQVARLTQVGGAWVNHGSVAFTGHPVSRLTASELAEHAAVHGFVKKDARDVDLPYLHSPASRQHRMENTHTLTMSLTKAPKKVGRHQHLPDWIVAANAPIPVGQSFQAQITTIRIHAFIMSLIDGKRSINDMALVLEEQRLMPKAQAVQAIRNFLITMLEEANRSGG